MNKQPKRVVIASCKILTDEPMVCWLCGETTTPNVTHTCRCEVKA